MTGWGRVQDHDHTNSLPALVPRACSRAPIRPGDDRFWLPGSAAAPRWSHVACSAGVRCPLVSALVSSSTPAITEGTNNGRDTDVIMREVIFRLQPDRHGHLLAHAEDMAIAISAPSLEELHHEAREALIAHLGPAHAAYQVRIRRSMPHTISSIRPLGRLQSRCG